MSPTVRLYEDDARLTHKGDRIDGWHIDQRIRSLVEEVINEANTRGVKIDLHDLASVLHGAIDTPICKEILLRRKRENNE